jgi:hypothetical protein
MAGMAGMQPSQLLLHEQPIPPPSTASSHSPTPPTAG